MKLANNQFKTLQKRQWDIRKRMTIMKAMNMQWLL